MTLEERLANVERLAASAALAIMYRGTPEGVQEVRRNLERDFARVYQAMNPPEGKKSDD